MKRLLVSVTAVTCTLVMGTGVTFAQDDGVPQFRPVEMWACNYKERKDQGDFDRALELLVAATGEEAYAAWRLFPYFTGPNQTFDFLYLGAWADGTAMGKDMTQYLETGEDAVEAWNEAVDCSASIMYASYQIQPVGNGDGGESFMMTVSDCTVGHAQSNGQALGAMGRFNDYRVANGSEVATFAWFPVYGGGGADFTFKLAQAYSNPQHFGDSFQWFVDHQAYLVQENMLGGVVSCDVPRVYNGETIMNNMNQD